MISVDSPQKINNVVDLQTEQKKTNTGNTSENGTFLIKDKKLNSKGSEIILNSPDKETKNIHKIAKKNIEVLSIVGKIPFVKKNPQWKEQKHVVSLVNSKNSTLNEQISKNYRQSSQVITNEATENNELPNSNEDTDFINLKDGLMILENLEENVNKEDISLAKPAEKFSNKKNPSSIQKASLENFEKPDSIPKVKDIEVLDNQADQILTYKSTKSKQENQNRDSIIIFNSEQTKNQILQKHQTLKSKEAKKSQQSSMNYSLSQKNRSLENKSQIFPKPKQIKEKKKSQQIQNNLSKIAIEIGLIEPGEQELPVANITIPDVVEVNRRKTSTFISGASNINKEKRQKHIKAFNQKDIQIQEIREISLLDSDSKHKSFVSKVKPNSEAHGKLNFESSRTLKEKNSMSGSMFFKDQDSEGFMTRMNPKDMELKFSYDSKFQIKSQNDTGPIQLSNPKKMKSEPMSGDISQQKLLQSSLWFGNKLKKNENFNESKQEIKNNIEIEDEKQKNDKLEFPKPINQQENLEVPKKQSSKGSKKSNPIKYPISEKNLIDLDDGEKPLEETKSKEKNQNFTTPKVTSKPESKKSQSIFQNQNVSEKQGSFQPSFESRSIASQQSSRRTYLGIYNQYHSQSRISDSIHISTHNSVSHGLSQRAVRAVEIKDYQLPEMILNHRRNSKTKLKEYLIKFRKCPPENSLWIPTDQIKNKFLIYEYRKDLAESKPYESLIEKRYSHRGFNNYDHFLLALQKNKPEFAETLRRYSKSNLLKQRFGLNRVTEQRMKRQLDKARQMFVSEGHVPPVKVVKSTGVSIEPGKMIQERKPRNRYEILKKERTGKFPGVIGGLNREFGKPIRQIFFGNKYGMKSKNVLKAKKIILIDECSNKKNIDLVNDQFPLKMDDRLISADQTLIKMKNVKDEISFIEIDKALKPMQTKINKIENGIKIHDKLKEEEKHILKETLEKSIRSETIKEGIQEKTVKSKEDLINLETNQDDLINRVNQMKMHAQRFISEKQKMMSLKESNNIENKNQLPENPNKELLCIEEPAKIFSKNQKISADKDNFSMINDKNKGQNLSFHVAKSEVQFVYDEANNSVDNEIKSLTNKNEKNQKFKEIKLGKREKSDDGELVIFNKMLKKVNFSKSDNKNISKMKFIDLA